MERIRERNKSGDEDGNKRKNLVQRGLRGTELRQILEENVRMEDKEWMNGFETAIYFGITYGALRNMIYRREIPFYKLGKRLRFRTEDVRNHLLKNQTGIKEWKACL